MFEKDEVEAGVRSLDRLCRREYGVTLPELLAASDEGLSARRLRRLTGVTLKRDYATSHAIGTRHTDTQANRYWEWKASIKAGKVHEPSNPSWLVLDGLRQALPDIHPDYAHRPRTWPALIDEGDHESGLFRVLARWVDDKLHQRPSRSFTEYYTGDASLNVGTAADIAETIFTFSTAPILASFIPGAGLVVPLVLIGARYGLTKMLVATNERDDAN